MSRPGDGDVERPDTPTQSLTSLFEDATAARRPAPLVDASLIVIWAVMLCVDGIDRCTASCHESLESRVPWFIVLSAAIVQLLTAVAAITLASVALYRGSLVAPWLTRSAPPYLLAALYTVITHAVATAATTNNQHDTPTRVLTATATAAPRLQLMLAPLLLGECFATDTITVMNRAALALIPPYVSGASCLLVVLIALIQRGGNVVLATPSAAGRVPLASFFASLFLAFWAIAGFLTLYSTHAKAIRIHLAAALPVLVIAVANFAVCQPALAAANGATNVTSGFAGCSQSALTSLIIGVVGVPSYLIAKHVECELDKVSSRIDTMSLTRLERMFPDRQDRISTPRGEP